MLKAPGSTLTFDREGTRTANQVKRDNYEDETQKNSTPEVSGGKVPLVAPSEPEPQGESVDDAANTFILGPTPSPAPKPEEDDDTPTPFRTSPRPY